MSKSYYICHVMRIRQDLFVGVLFSFLDEDY
jgi:hypothetical protein